MDDNSIPPGIDLTQDESPRILSSMIALIILPTIFVIGRMVSRVIARAGFWWDDFWVVIALFLSYGPCICDIMAVHTQTLGKHIYVLPPSRIPEFFRILYIFEIFYYSAVSAVKICILTFYRRVFKVDELKWVLHGAAVVVAIFYAGALLASLFQCTPVEHFWNRQTTAGHCVDGDNILLIPGAINCVLDALVIILPLPLLWRLRTTTSQKGVLTGIFICAGFVCIISIIRLVVLARLKDADLTWNYVDAAVWSAAEPAMGVISACLPSLRPLISLMIRGTISAVGSPKPGPNPQKSVSSSSSRRMWSNRVEDERDQPFLRLEEMTADQKNAGRWGHVVSAMGPGAKKPGGDDLSLEELNIPEGNIRVREEIVITTSDWIDYKDRVY